MIAILLDLLRGLDAEPNDWRQYIDLLADCFRDHEQENLADRMASISRSPFEPYTEHSAPRSVLVLKRCQRTRYSDSGPLASTRADDQLLRRLIEARFAGQEKS